MQQKCYWRNAEINHQFWGRNIQFHKKEKPAHLMG
jgi:hypothetical protein